MSLMGAMPEDPNEVYGAVSIDLKENVPAAEWQYMRYLSLWPNDPASVSSLNTDIYYQCNSLSWTPELYSPVYVEDLGLWRIDYRRYGWSKQSWENLADEDPYFAVTVKDSNGVIIRGWLDPKVEATIRDATRSRKAVLRADFFLPRTSVDQLGKFKGFYSDFLKLPKTEKELIEILGAKEEQIISKTEYFNKLFLLQGGAVQESEVALHNRALELLPTVVGKRSSRFLWRSKDTDSNADAASVLENNTQGGNIKFAGKEHIYSLPNGLHGYFICDANNNRITAVPTETVAQDKRNQFDKVVYLGTFKCGQCHAAAEGIIGFDDVLRRTKVGKRTSIGIITKGDYDKQIQQFLEAYHTHELGKDAVEHRKVYAETIKELTTGMTPQECIKNHLHWVEGYFYGKVDRMTAGIETGMFDQVDKYIEKTSPSPLVQLNGDTGREWIARELWERRYATLMQTKVWDWEKP